MTEPDRERLYVARAKESIRDVLDEQLAVISAELEARISERGFISSGENIDPHHVTTALRELTRAGFVVPDKSVSKGGHEIETIQPADQRRRTTKIAHAASRKRLLAARYAGWSQGTQRHPHGLIGPAGENAVRAAVLDANTLQPAAPGAGAVGELLGIKLPGAADSAGFMVPLVDGIPGDPVTLIVEVKNIRGWIYPQSAELYQVLHKASLLQLARPAQPILPVLICRRCHPTTFYMAKQLGFFVIDTQRQFAGDVPEEHASEVRAELHFQDLVRGSERSIRVRDRFRKTLPKHCTEMAAVWRETCSTNDYPSQFERLRAQKLRLTDRSTLMDELRQAAAEHGLDGGW